MECPHLCDSVKVNRDFIKNKKYELSTSSGNQPQNPTTNATSTAVNNDGCTSSSSSSSNGTNNKLWKCLECTSDKENWMCLNCGQVLCGRYQNGHALHHSTSNAQHDVCLSTLNCSVYCYKCDDYVTNETNLLDNLREEFKDDDSSSEASNSDESSSVKSSSNRRSQTTGRRLRPRKRTNSNENGIDSPTMKKPLRKIIGIRNSGNTCFMNAVLQALNNIQEFRIYFNGIPSLETKPQKRVYYSRSTKENEDDINMGEELRKVIVNLNQSEATKAISADCLFRVVYTFVPHFRGHLQHDAHEFLRYMLDRVHYELQSSAKQTDTMSLNPLKIDSKMPALSNVIESNIVTNVFGGTLQSEVRCLICGMESKKHDPFLDLSLDIPEKFYKENDGEGKPICNITDCLSSFTEVEELNETELYYCNSCKCKQKSTKRFWIRRLPNVLCLHIKRFRWNNFFRTKIGIRIKFPLESLDMSQYVLNSDPDTRRSNSSNNIYDLTAAVVHIGNGMSCGHYTSFVNQNGTWLHYNDHIIKEVSANEVADCKPYILFYNRRDANNSL